LDVSENSYTVSPQTQKNRNEGKRRSNLMQVNVCLIVTRWACWADWQFL